MRARFAAAAGPISAPVLLVGLVVAALLALSVERGLAWQEQRQLFAAEKAASEAAVAHVEKLITVDGSTSKETIDSLLDGATGDFRAELATHADRLARALSKSKVTTTGEVVSAGVVKADAKQATVIVAATGTVQNKHAKDAQPRNYRLSVDLRRVEGRWLISGLEFVA